MREKEEEEESMVIERSMIYLAEGEGSESDLEIKDDKGDLWQIEELVGN